ncbi:hypothetical protein GMST_08620 [Geomonas silvestris]|uniref:AsmA domain-containing protein n=1 Tax=Geomonas silvestris TaxID=2740184 RepID=A0A6V8MEX9_9BACT|nr:DUF748 domain-containing protein [Geomonas silvestris]GFO58537.1 hypothetical protein GMST_08620 [Geomonas silvestris]
MSEPAHEKTENQGTRRSLLRRILLAVACLLILMVLTAGLYLATPLPARHLSRLGSSFLHQGLVVERLEISGATLYLRGLKLENPPGFARGNLAAADTVAVAPSWSDLMAGRQRYRLIELKGLKVNLEQNSRGTWNFSQLQKLLAARKPSPTETRIDRLALDSGSLTINGQGVEGISLKVYNLATKGSTSSDLDLSFEDSGRNRFTLTGKLRPGPEPDLDLQLAAPRLALAKTAALLQLKVPELLQGGTGSLELKAGLHRKELSASGLFRFAGMSYRVAGKPYPLAGRLEFAAGYGLKRDTARLEMARLELDGLVRVSASATVRGVKKERAFAADLGFSDVDLAHLGALVPEKARRGLSVAGRLSGDTLHLAGRGNELTTATGSLHLREGRLERAGRLLVAGLSSDLTFSRSPEGVLAQGRCSASAAKSAALVEALDLPVRVELSPRLKPVSAESSGFSARVFGTDLSGKGAYHPARPAPLNLSLKVPAARLANFQSLLQKYQVSASSGTAALELEASGRDLQQLTATLNVHLAGVSGRRGKNAVELKDGVVAAKLRRSAGHLFAEGNADLKGAAWDATRGSAGFAYRLADRQLSLEAARAELGATRFSFAHLNTTLPAASGAKGGPAPLVLQFDGASLSWKELAVSSLAGALRGRIVSEAGGRWIDGSGELSAAALTWQRKPVAAPVLKLSFAKAGGKAELGGKLAGGALSGVVSADPFAPGSGTRFDLTLKDAELVNVAPFLPKNPSVLPAAGKVDLHLAGSYQKGPGFACRLDGAAREVALTRSGGKGLVRGAALNLSGELAKDQLSVTKAQLMPGPGVNLGIRGTLNRPFAPERAGWFTFTLAEVSATNLVDALIDLLPRALQEANLDGALAAQGRLDLGQGSRLLEGTLDFKGARFELPQQKLTVSGIDGRFPFSLDLSGKAGGKPPASMAFSRDNYQKLLEQLRSQRSSGEVVRVAKIAFGPLELGALTMHLNATRGTTEISALSSSLYEGALLGKGYLTLHQGVNYRGDLLLNGMSLRQLCSIFPGIQGYISGRVDGVFSVSGGAHGLAGITGFTELWARDGKGEKMLVSKEFLQRLAKQKLSGFFFRSDRSYDEAEIKAIMEGGYLTFDSLKILHTNFIGVKDLNVSIAPTQNRIALDHLLDSVKQAATRGKAATGEPAPAGAPEAAPEAAPAPEFKWGE